LTIGAPRAQQLRDLLQLVRGAERAAPGQDRHLLAGVEDLRGALELFPIG
jgi:hypothetical protein